MPPARPVAVACEHCGIQWTTTPSKIRQNKAKFCSRECSNANKRDHTKCEGCGISFTVPANRNRRFCSRRCANRSRANNKVRYECERCGKEFWQWPSQNPKFCSRDCQDLHWANKAEIFCLECGQVFVDDASQNRKYCSSECYRAFNKVRVADGVAYIALTNQKREFVAETVVDLQDLERIRALGRRVSPGWVAKRKQYLAYVKVDDETCALARFILEAWKYPGAEVDHRDGQVLRNVRQNLRLVTKTKNMQNRQGATKLSGSGKRNVYWHERRRKYQVKMQVDGKPHHVGYFATLEEADEAAIAARRKFMTHSER